MEHNLFISKFWVRIWAFLIDSLILGVFGYILGLIFSNFFISLGESAKLVGWIISLAYFSILNSNIHQGQTFGKKWMNIQVVDITGNPVSLKTSFIRALVYTTPFFLNGFKIPGLHTFSIVTIMQGVIIFTGGIGIIVFYIFNKETRQSLHDIIAKTYVVQEYRNNEFSFMPAVKKLPYYITGGIFAIVIMTSIYGLNSNSEIKKLVPVYEEILAQDHISNASVSMNYSSLGNSENNRLSYTVFIKVDKNLKSEDNNNNPELKKAVETFINSKVYETDNDILNAVVGSGFNIGIASQNYSYSFSRPIHEWKRIYQQ